MTDVNNWYVTADKAQVPLIELSFLDGRRDPEVFVMDNPSQGSMFTNDKMTLKMRHIFGGAVADARGFQGNIVA